MKYRGPSAKSLQAELTDIESSDYMDPLSEFFMQQKKYGGKGISLQEEAAAMKQVSELKEKLREDTGASDSELEDEFMMSEIIQMRKDLAAAYVTLAQHDRAVVQLQKTLELYKDAYGPVSDEACASSVELRDLLKETGRFIEAADIQNTIIVLRSRLTRSYAIDEAKSDHGEIELARSGALSVDIGREWYELGCIYREMGSADASNQAFHRALDIFKSKYTASDAGSGAQSETLGQYYFSTQVELGHIQYRAKEYEEALKFYQSAVEVPLHLELLRHQMSDTFTEKSSEQVETVDTRWNQLIVESVIDTYTNMGNSCLFLGRTEEAEKYFKLAVENSQHNQEKTASLLHSLSVLYGMLTQELPDTSSKSFLRLASLVESYAGDAIKILTSELKSLTDVPLNSSTLATELGRKKLKQLTEYTQSHITLGTLYTRVQKLQQAEDIFKVALETLDNMQAAFKSSGEGSGDMAVATTVMPNLRKDMAFIFNHLAEIHQKRDRPQDALDTYKKALELAKSMADKTNPILGTICRNVGVLYMTEYSRLEGGSLTKEKAMELAEDSIKQSYDLFHNAYPTDYHPDLGDIAKQLGLLYSKKNEWRLAMHHLEDSIDTFLILDDQNPAATRVDEGLRLYREAARMWQSHIEAKKKSLGENIAKDDLDELESNLTYIKSKLDNAQGKENVMKIKRNTHYNKRATQPPPQQ